jgi:hypothetical protein
MEGKTEQNIPRKSLGRNSQWVLGLHAGYGLDQLNLPQDLYD